MIWLAIILLIIFSFFNNLFGNAIMASAFIFPKAIPVILALGAVEAAVMLIDHDSAEWTEGANNDVLNWVSEATNDVPTSLKKSSLAQTLADRANTRNNIGMT
jgi:hypothetical protein